MHINLCNACNGTGISFKDSSTCEHCKGYGRLATTTYTLTVTLDDMYNKDVIAADTQIFNIIRETEAKLRNNQQQKQLQNEH
jgi:RecJ-like exonuclease